LFLVMYDIGSDTVRRDVVKYLERLGCLRIQKSIFLAHLPVSIYQSIRTDLEEMVSFYENHDSIIVCPLSPELLRNMKVIGENYNIDVLMRNKKVLFL